MKKLLTRVMSFLGTLVLLTAIAIAAVLLVDWLGRKVVPPRAILELDLERGLVEHVPPDPVAQFAARDKMRLHRVVDGLSRAAQDERVVGIVARVGPSPMGWATIQELRDAVREVGEGGKPTVAFAETFGEFAAGNRAYYLATSFQDIYMQPSGDVGLTGLIAEQPFLAGSLDKIGLVARGDRREEYKTALNHLTETTFSPAHREAVAAVMDSTFAQMVKGIAEARGLKETSLRGLIDRGPFFGEEAVKEGLVDSLLYRAEARERIQESLDEEAELFPFADYLAATGEWHREGRVVALIYGIGNVLRGASQYDPVSGQQIMGSDTVAGAFRAAIEDDEVEAILFRVSSPGGS